MLAEISLSLSFSCPWKIRLVKSEEKNLVLLGWWAAGGEESSAKDSLASHPPSQTLLCRRHSPSIQPAESVLPSLSFVCWKTNIGLLLRLADLAGPLTRVWLGTYRLFTILHTAHTQKGDQRKAITCPQHKTLSAEHLELSTLRTEPIQEYRGGLMK